MICFRNPEMFSFLLQAILVFLLHHSNCSIVRNIKCAVPNDPDNGKAVYESLDVGSALYYECNKGFFLSSDFVRECTKDGLWNGEEGFCQAAPCDVPKDPVDGKAFYESLEFGSKLHYKCNEGFVLSEDIVRECTENGLWNGHEPSCQEKCRDAPPPLRNAYIEHFENEHNGVVVYKCNSFFSLEDNGSIACNSGVWKGKLPVCKDTRCYMRSFSNTPGLLVDEKKIFYSGQSFTPQCYDSYEVSKQRDGKIYCYNGEWTGNIPPCKETSCTEPPPEPVNGKAIKYTGENGTSVVYRCDDSFIMEQYSVVECLYGNWEGTPPVCKDTRCYLKDLRYNEGVHLEDDSPTMPNENASLTCEEGYIMTFSPPTCLRGEWKNRHQFSPCQQADCKVETIDNGVTKVLRRNVEERPNIKLEEDDFIVIDVESWKKSGDNAFVFCEPSHTFHGRGDPGYAKITCEKGKWRPLPSCLLRPCRTPSVSNGRFGNYATSRYNSRKSFKTVYEGTVTDDGTEFVWICNINYEAPGNGERENKVVCENGTWSKDIQCVPAHCRSPPPAMQNAYVESFGKAHGGTVSYKCNHFFQLIRPSTVVCHFGTWTGSPGECRDTSCTTHRAPESEHGKSRPYQQRHGSIVQYDCDDGYYKTQEGNVNCQYGVWTGNPPACERNTSCEDPSAPENGEVIYNSTEIGAILTYKCKSGFNLKPNGTRECTSEGEWSGEHPVCEQVECPLIPESNGMTIDYHPNRLIYGRAIFHCSRLLKRYGPFILRCLPSGTWSGQFPSCRNVTCNMATIFDVLPHGVVPKVENLETDTLPVGHSFDLGCDEENHYVFGTNKITCYTSGHWRIAGYVDCQLGCGPLKKDSTSRLIINKEKDNYRFGDSVELSCPSGEILTEDVVRVFCLSNGWSEQDIPDCKPAKT